MTASQRAVVHLRRNLGARLVGGSRLHAVLTVVFALDLVATVIVAATGHARAGLVVLPYSTAVLFLLCAFGFAAGAGCEDGGIAWRTITRRAFLWKDVGAVHLTSAPRGFLGSARRPAIGVTVGRFDYQVTPALGVSRDRLVEFARQVSGSAAAAGVAVEVDRAYWDGVTGTGPGAPRSSTPGGTA